MRVLPLIALSFLAAASEPALAQMPANDAVKGAVDHPLLSRFEGSKLVGFGRKEFDEVALAAGKATRNKENKTVFETTAKVEGKFTRIAYVYPKERSSLEVMRNYQAALEKAGLKEVFSCSKDSCGKDFGELFLQRSGNNFLQGGEAHSSPFNYGRDDERYLLAKGVRADGSQVYAGVYVVQPVQDKLGGIYLEIVEPKPMEGGKVQASLKAEEMAKSIASDGKIAVYGVYFDTGKADIKPESKDALAEMARLLQKDAALKVYIVGHTDNQGALATNVELSQKRAEAVVKALAGEYKIDAKRLSAKGAASFAPVSTNDSEAGRVKNRRVELVKQ